jgi:hypothetical protein
VRRVATPRRTSIADYAREQVQPLPHWQTMPQRQPGRRVSLFFFAI